MSKARVAIFATLAPLLLSCCPSPKLPKGPPPEYEDPPPPSWLNDGGADAPSPPPPAAPGTTTITPSAPDAG